MNSFRVIFGQPYCDTGELFIGTKSTLACDVVPFSYTLLCFRKKLFPELRQNTSGLPDFFFPAAERWVRWRCLLLRASRDSSFLSYWTTWQSWTASTCSCTFTFLGDRTRLVKLNGNNNNNNDLYISHQQLKSSKFLLKPVSEKNDCVE